MRAAAGFSLVLAAAIGGCTSVNPTSASFEGTHWQATAVNGQVVLPSHRNRIHFRGGRIGGGVGCNSFGGTYRITGGQMIVNVGSVTRMACGEPGTKIEQSVLAVLRQPVWIGWHSDRHVMLTNSSGAITLERLR